MWTIYDRFIVHDPKWINLKKNSTYCLIDLKIPIFQQAKVNLDVVFKHFNFPRLFRYDCVYVCVKIDSFIKICGECYSLSFKLEFHTEPPKKKWDFCVWVWRKWQRSINYRILRLLNTRRNRKPYCEWIVLNCRAKPPKWIMIFVKWMIVCHDLFYFFICRHQCELNVCSLSHVDVILLLFLLLFYYQTTTNVKILFFRNYDSLLIAILWHLTNTHTLR